MAILKVQREALGIDGGRGDDDFEVGPLWQQLPQVAEQKIDVQRALVRLVDDDGVVGVEEFVSLCFGEQDAVGHQLDEAVLRALFGEAHLEADALADLLAQLFRDASRHAAGGDATRLRVADQPVPPAPGGERDLRQLCRLARAGLSGQHHHLMVADQRGDLVGPLRDWQAFGVDDRWRTREAIAKARLRAGNVGGELIGLELLRLALDAPVVRQQHGLAVQRGRSAG